MTPCGAPWPTACREQPDHFGSGRGVGGRKTCGPVPGDAAGRGGGGYPYAGHDGVAACKILRSELPEVRLLILTTFDDDEYLRELFGLGVDGYLLKTAARPVWPKRYAVFTTASVRWTRASAASWAGAEKAGDRPPHRDGAAGSPPHREGKIQQRDCRGTGDYLRPDTKPGFRCLPQAGGLWTGGSNRQAGKGVTK